MKVVGIIGGVGPSATVDLYRLIISHTPAKKDQEHLRVIIDSNTQIPDRTKALLFGGESPLDEMRTSIKVLESSGVEKISCPCNTAHVFLRKIKNEISVPFIDMIEETMKFLKEKGIKKAGLLSTSGTVDANIYQETGEKYGIKIIAPSENGIKKEMEAIYGEKGIKAGIEFEKSTCNKSLFLKVLEEFREKEIEIAIMGCTEIPLCLEQSDTDFFLVNPTEILAKAIVRESK